MRKIIHIDMDAFYASVEQRDDPALREKPIAVGGSSKRGVVMTASYQARKFGVRSAMPSAVAARLCPDLIFVKPRFDIYKQVSKQIRTIFFSYTDQVEPLSLDEAYLDVTQNKPGIESAVKIARDIKNTIHQHTQLTASAGVSVIKFLAKVASDDRKPNGLSVILPHQVQGFIEALPIDKFHGIGKVTADRMHQMGIRTGGDLKNFNEQQLVELFGKPGRFYHQISHGIDHRPVNPDRIRKSVSHETTFETDIIDRSVLSSEMMKLATSVMNWMAKHETYGRTVTLKVKFNDFQQITRSKTHLTLIDNIEMLHHSLKQLLEAVHNPRPVRLLGVGISNLNLEEPGQLRLDL